MDLRAEVFQVRLRLRLDVKEKALPDRRAESGESLLSRAIMQLIG